MAPNAEIEQQQEIFVDDSSIEEEGDAHLNENMQAYDLARENTLVWKPIGDDLFNLEEVNCDHHVEEASIQALNITNLKQQKQELDARTI